MNTCSTNEAIENGLSAIFRQFSAADLGETWIRTASNGNDLGHENGERSFPQLYIMSTPKALDSDGVTYSVQISVDVGTFFDDDKNCRVRSKLFFEVERILDSLLSPCTATGGRREIIDYFSNVVREAIPGFTLGGLVPNGGGFPQTVDGAQIMTYDASVYFGIYTED